VVGLERGPLSLVSTTEELLDRKEAAPVQKTEDTAVGIRYADHVAPSIPKSWQPLRRQAAVAWWVCSLADSDHGVFLKDLRSAVSVGTYSLLGLFTYFFLQRRFVRLIHMLSVQTVARSSRYSEGPVS
jgi:hypothetical protein